MAGHSRWSLQHRLSSWSQPVVRRMRALRRPPCPAASPAQLHGLGMVPAQLLLVCSLQARRGQRQRQRGWQRRREEVRGWEERTRHLVTRSIGRQKQTRSSSRPQGSCAFHLQKHQLGWLGRIAPTLHLLGSRWEELQRSLLLSTALWKAALLGSWVQRQLCRTTITALSCSLAQSAFSQL